MKSIILSIILICIPVMAAKTSKTIPVPVIPAVKTTAIEGQAFLKTQGGDVKTCAGETVILFEQHDYYKLLKKEIYNKKIALLSKFESNAEIYDKHRGSDLTFKLASKNINQLKMDYPELGIRDVYEYQTFLEDIKKAKELETKKYVEIGEMPQNYIESICDANGNFIFKNIPYGNYGIVTTVRWNRVEASRYSSPYTVTEGGKVGKLFNVDDNLQKVYITETIQ